MSLSWSQQLVVDCIKQDREFKDACDRARGKRMDSVLLERAAKLASECDEQVSLHWDEENGPYLTVDSSDLFAWGYADLEVITPEFLDLWEKALRDIQAILSEEEKKHWPRNSVQLALCRREKSRPQGAYYKYFPKETWPLFNACGPYREAELGNPYHTPDDEHPPKEEKK